MPVQYRELGAPKVGFDLSGQNIGFPTPVDAEELQSKVMIASVSDLLSSLAHLCFTERLTTASVQVQKAKRYKGSQLFTVDLSLNHISLDQLPSLLTLLDELPKLRLDLSANDFQWEDLKAVIHEGFNPQGYR